MNATMRVVLSRLKLRDVHTEERTDEEILLNFVSTHKNIVSLNVLHVSRANESLKNQTNLMISLKRLQEKMNLENHLVPKEDWAHSRAYSACHDRVHGQQLSRG